MQQNPVVVTDFAAGEEHGRREEGLCLNTQVDSSEVPSVRVRGRGGCRYLEHQGQMDGKR